jgi:hypothetical protein
VHDHLDVRGRDVRVRVQEVLPQVAGVELGRVDGVLLGFDVDCVFDRVGCYNDAVVCFGVSEGFVSWGELGMAVAYVSLDLRCLDLALEQAAHGHLSHGVDARLRVLLDFADADIVLAVAGGGESGHGGGIL